MYWALSPAQSPYLYMWSLSGLSRRRRMPLARYPRPRPGARFLVAGFLLSIVVLLAAAGLRGGTHSLVLASGAAALNRPADPVVLTGADVPSLTGMPPSDLIGFRYAGGWAQVPVQVDERAILDYSVVYHNGPSAVS